MSTINFNFFRFSWKFIFIGQFFILICNFRIIFIVVYCVVFYNKTLRCMALRRSHFQCGKCEGRRSQSSAARRPSPCTPTLLGTEGVLRCCVCCVVDFCLYDAVLRMELCADLVSVFFGTYGDTLCRSAIWFWDSSVLMVVCCADLRSGSGILRYLWWFAVPICDLVLGFFGTYGGMLCRSGSGFFDIYDGTLCRSGSCILDSLMFL